MSINVENKTLSVDYQSYEDLVDFSNNLKLDQYLSKLRSILEDEAHWLEQFQGINNLRRLQKFHNEKFYAAFKETYPSIIKLSASIRSNLSKLALILIKEFFIFQNFHIQEVSILKKIINSILIQSAIMKTFIKEEALACLEELVSNDSYCNLFTISFLVEEMTNKNLQISENACVTCENILKKIPAEELSAQENYIILNNVLVHIVNLNSVKKENWTKKALRIFDLIYTKLGRDDFYTLINYGNGKHYKNVFEEMEKILLSKSKSKTQTNFKDIIKQKKFN